MPACLKSTAVALWQLGLHVNPSPSTDAQTETYLILPSSHRKSGLEFATAADGTSEWVRPEDVERFKIKGEALLGKEAKENEGALSQLGAMQQQLVVDKAENEEQKQLLIDAQNQLLARRGCKSCGCVLS